MTFSDSGIVSALSDYISQNPLELLDGSLCISGTSKSNLKGDASPHGANGELGPEMKPGKRSEYLLCMVMFNSFQLFTSLDNSICL